MAHPNNYVFDINIENIESAFDRVKANKDTDGQIFIKHSYDLANAIKSNSNFIFVTDSVSLDDFNAKKGTATYYSLINDTRLKNIYISLHDDRNHKNLFILLNDILVSHPTLRSLELKTAHNTSTINKTFHEEYCELFCSGLRHARGLKELTIYDAEEFSETTIQMLAKAIEDNKTITSLKLVAPLAVTQAIATSLKKNTRIKILQIERLYYFDAPFNITFIKELFDENTTIKTLSFSNIVYTDADVDPFMSFLETTTSLKTLQFPISNYYLTGNIINCNQPQFKENIFPKFIQNIMRPNTSLRTLDIPHLITDDLNRLFRALVNNSTLTTLRIGKIDLDDDPNDEDEPEHWSNLSINGDTIHAWNDLLTKNKTLKEISFDGFICNHEELAKFNKDSVDWFKHNKTLTKLDLRANNATKILLGDALVHNKTLKAFKCTRRFIPDPVWQELLTNTTLTEIDFSDYFTRDKNDTVKFLQYNSTVQTLTSTLWHYEGDLFLEELANNTSITSYTNTLPAYDGQYSGKSIAALKKNWNLTDLDLQNNWCKTFYEPILIRNRDFKLSLTLVMHNIARQKPTMFPMEIWRLIFRHLTPDLSILV